MNLDGVEYLVIQDPRKIKEYVRVVVNKEWEKEDFDKYGEDLNTNWVLREVDVKEIKRNKELDFLEYFKKDLYVRVSNILKLLNQKKMIPPLILRGKDLLIFDGYARLEAFNKKGIKKCLAYVSS